MPIGAGLLLGASAVGGLINGAMSMGNSALDRSHASSENVKNRDFTAGENALNRNFTAQENALGREFSANEAQKARAWQERMSNTALSRQIADAQNAGLNPALMGDFGGAQAPGAVVGSAGSMGAGSSSASMVSAGGHNVLGFNIDALIKAMATTSMQNGKDFVKNVAKDSHSATEAKVKTAKKLVDDDFDEAEWNDLMKRLGY